MDVDICRLMRTYRFNMLRDGPAFLVILFL